MCVVDAETGKPVSGAYVRGRRDWNITEEDGCTELKYREDTLIVVRIGYRSEKLPFKDTVRLYPSPVRLKDVEVVAVKVKAVEHLPFQVEVRRGEEVQGAFGPLLPGAEVSTAAYGTEFAKPVFRAFSVKRLTVLRDGFEVRDLSSGADHPIHLYGGDVGAVTLVKGSAGAVFGGGFGGTIYVRSREAEFSRLSHTLRLSLNSNGYRKALSYALNAGGNRVATLLGVEGNLSDDYTSGFGPVPNSFGRRLLLFSQLRGKVWGYTPALGGRYEVRTWGIPLEKAVSHSTHYEAYLLSGGIGANYQSTLQVEMCGRDTVTSIRKDVIQGKYDFTLRGYNGTLRVVRESMMGGRAGEGSKVEGYASLYGPILVRERFQVVGGLGGKVVGRKWDVSALLGTSLTVSKVKVGLTFARSFRFPTLYEMHFVGPHHGVGRYDIGNPNLKREVSYEVQIVLRRQVGPVSLSLEGFGDFIKDFITVFPTGEEYVDEEGHRMGVYRWENADALFWGWTPRASLSLKDAYISLSYSRISSRLMGGGEVPYMPVPEFRLEGKAVRGWVFGRFTVRYAEGKVLGDLGVGVRMGNYEVSVGVFNPTNAAWYEPTDPLRTPVPGRSLYLSLHLTR